MRRTIGVIFLLGVLILNLYKTFNFLWADITVMENFPRLTYGQKMQAKYGLYYDFMEFVKKNTPDDAVILIPPSMVPFMASGNSYLSNYFLYPRRLINGQLNKPPQYLNRYNYVLVVWKDFEEKGEESLYGWPKFSVPAKEILYMATVNSGIDAVKKGDYLPNDQMNIGHYGLIKL